MNLENACSDMERQLKGIYELLRRKDPDRANAILKLAMAMVPDPNIFHGEDLGFIRSKSLFRTVVDRGMRTDVFVKHYLDVLIVILDAVESIQGKKVGEATQDEIVEAIVDGDALGVKSAIRKAVTAKRLVINPMKEITGLGRYRDLLGNLKKGVIYLIIDDENDRAFTAFTAYVHNGYHGLCITRRFPAKIRKEHDLMKTPMIWLSQSDSDEDTLDPTDLDKIVSILKDFFSKVDDAIVLIEGVEYLIIQNGFDDVLRFLQKVNELVIINETILVIPFNEAALQPREMALLKTEMEVMERKKGPSGSGDALSARF